MGYRRLGLAVFAALGLFATLKSDPARAGSAEALAALRADMRPVLSTPVLFHHSQRTQSFYCYPKNYWWFYRPYTTALDNHPRCMPYFHYLGPGARGAKPDGSIK